MSQAAGRDSIFENCTITVFNPVRVYGIDWREQAPSDSNRYLELV